MRGKLQNQVDKYSEQSKRLTVKHPSKTFFPKLFLRFRKLVVLQTYKGKFCGGKTARA